MAQETFLVSGIPMVNLNPSGLDEQVNNWTREHPEMEILERHLHTSTTTFQQEGYARTIITICVVLVYEPFQVVTQP